MLYWLAGYRQQPLFDEDPAGGSSVSLREVTASLAAPDFSTVNIEITVGTGATQDKTDRHRQPGAEAGRQRQLATPNDK